MTLTLGEMISSVVPWQRQALVEHPSMVATLFSQVWRILHAFLEVFPLPHGGEVDFIGLDGLRCRQADAASEKQPEQDERGKAALAQG
jgi:hypothetical protein